MAHTVDKTQTKAGPVPKGLKDNWGSDAMSGFLVSLIALPLSLGIAAASGFPPVMGVLTAIVGGTLVSLIMGAEMTIKGPAAGLIVIVAGAVEELGKGDSQLGWQLALGVVVAAGLLQVVLGVLKVAKLADFFPLSAVHGMLAAIGIIIMSKQLHFALGADPAGLKGKEPLELLAMLPETIAHPTVAIAIIGIVSLIILFGMPMLPFKWSKKVPPALVVLIAGIVLGQVLHLGDAQYAAYNPLVNPGTLSLSINANFGAIGGELLPVFLKYLAMFTLIGSLESLLTVKAIDMLDPWKRKSNLSKDLTAVGAGNIVSGLLGGLPMISEVARSSANINNGGRTRWANFFHGISLFLFVLFLTPVIKMVPVASLAAMLIYVGYRLASPKEFAHMWQIGREQLAIFATTIVATLATDLLIGVGVGILLKIIIELSAGVPLRHVFKPKADLVFEDNQYTLRIRKAATFSNYLSLKKLLDKVPGGSQLNIYLEDMKYIDHTVLENLHHFQTDFEHAGGHLKLIGLEKLQPRSSHTLAARRGH